MLFEPLKLLQGKGLDVDERIIGTLDGANQLIEFQMNGRKVPVFCVLQQENHQEGNETRHRPDWLLPMPAVDAWSHQEPEDHAEERHGKCQRLPQDMFCSSR